ncbi:MAG: hypothetical protein KGI49_00065 [Patescibacteria group bacterium]|nr:hypothetical protein [Patescibacteria group bacterium]
MITTRSAKGISWIDLESPVDEEIAGLVQRYGIHPLVGEELKSSASSAKAELYKDYLLVVMTMPVRTKIDGTHAIEDREIDFVIGKDFLITSHFETIDTLDNFAKIFEANAILDKEAKFDHAGHLFYYIVMKLYGAMVDDLENIRDDLSVAETRIFRGDERRMVEVLSKLSRELIDFRQTARVHKDIWSDMLEAEDKYLFGSDFKPYVKAISDEFERIHDIIANCRELVADLRETNDSLLNTHQNDIIRTLTVINFIFIPATFIAALFTIPASYVPLIGSDIGWTIILAGMVAITIGIWWLIKRKNWI